MDYKKKNKYSERSHGLKATKRTFALMAAPPTPGGWRVGYKEFPPKYMNPIELRRSLRESRQQTATANLNGEKFLDEIYKLNKDIDSLHEQLQDNQVTIQKLRNQIDAFHRLLFFANDVLAFMEIPQDADSKRLYKTKRRFYEDARDRYLLDYPTREYDANSRYSKG